MRYKPKLRQARKGKNKGKWAIRRGTGQFFFGFGKTRGAHYSE